MSRNDWRKSSEAPGYAVTSDGMIKRLKTGNVLSPSMNNAGYLTVNVGSKADRVGKSVHRIVAREFVDGYAPGLDVNQYEFESEKLAKYTIVLPIALEPLKVASHRLVSA